MYTSLFHSLAVALLTASLGLAFEEIDTNKTVIAGKDASVQIVNDLSRGRESFDGMFDSYRVYLSLTPPGWGPGPACYLVNSSAINVTSLTVQISASVGPSDSISQVYSIATVEFNQDSNANNGPSGFEYSRYFNFVGGTGKWSEYELAGFLVGIPDLIPCSAYDCARQCSQKYYPDNVNSNSASAYKSTYDCTAACPGVSYPPFDSIYGGSGGPSNGSSSGSSGASSVGPTVTTSLAAAGGFTQAASSAMLTGSKSASTTGSSSNTQAASTLPSSGTSSTSSTVGASTPTTSKSAAILISPSRLTAVVAGLTLVFDQFRF